jgi:predicted transcriptional regulator
MKTAMNIRLPEEMKKALDKIAEDEFRSTHSVILQSLDEMLKSKGVDWRKEKNKRAKPEN